MVWRSIKWRLQVWHGLLLLAVMTAFGFTAHELQRAGELRRVDGELKQRVGAVVNSLRDPMRNPPRPPLETGPDAAPPSRAGERPRPPRRDPLAPREPGRELVSGPAANLFGNPEDGDFYYVLWGRDGLELGRSANAPATGGSPCDLQDGPRRFTTRQRGVFREMTHALPPGECILVGRSIAAELAALRQFNLRLGGLGAGVLLLGLAGGWWVAARAIRPLQDISATAARIASGDLSQRIPAAETDSELGQLAAVLNTTFARLDDAFQRQARFTADASHELRTPISVILNQTQSTLARDRSAAEYRETLEACQRAAQRMRRLTETLLALARTDAGREPLPATPVDLATLAQECLDLVRPLADERRLQLHARLEPARARGDADRLALVVTNLLTNAIHHNREGGEIRIATRTENGHAVLAVADTGPGIPAEHLPHIFERFYRADPARTAAQGRSGLGLSIARAITEAHRGTLAAHSPPGQGATFTLSLPQADEA